MEIDKLREMFDSIDVNVEDLTDEEVIEVAQVILASTIRLCKAYTQFVTDSLQILRKAGSKLAALKEGSDGPES